MTMNKAFSDTVAREGYTRRFRSGSSQSDTGEVECEASSSADGLTTGVTPKDVAANQLLHEYPELKAIMGPPTLTHTTLKQDIMP